MKIPELFASGVRVLMLIDRGVQGSNKGSKRWINKLISTDQNSFYKCVEKLSFQKGVLNDPNIRLYCSLNNRKVKVAINMLKHKMIDVLDEDEVDFYANIKNQFISCLMKPECRESKYFLLDIDTKEIGEPTSKMVELGAQVVHKYETPNGYHFIINPMDVKLLETIPYCTVKRDGLLLINRVDDGNIV